MSTLLEFPYLTTVFCVIIAAVILLGLNIRVFRIVRQITNVSGPAETEGSQPLKSGYQLICFLCQLDSKNLPADWPQLPETRSAVFRLRKQIKRSVAVALLLLSIGFGLATPFPFYCLIFTLIALLIMLMREIL